jgi:hypothetical protein
VGKKREKREEVVNIIEVHYMYENSTVKLTQICLKGVGGRREGS